MPWPFLEPSLSLTLTLFEVESKCLTHLGHNLPEGGVDRYCIDLVCVAGSPLAAGDPRTKILSKLQEGPILHEEFDSESYRSSAASFSGTNGHGAGGLVLGAVAVLAVGLAAVGLYVMRNGKFDGRGDHQPIKDVGQSDSSDKLDHTSEATIRKAS